MRRIRIAVIDGKGGGLGRAIRNFRQAASEPDEIDVTPKAKKIEDDDNKA